MTQPAIFFEEVNERQGVFHRRAILLGEVVGKAWLVLLTLPAIDWLRLRDRRLGRA